MPPPHVHDTEPFGPVSHHHAPTAIPNMHRIGEQGQRVAGCVDHSPATAMVHGKWADGAGAFHGRGSISTTPRSMAERAGHVPPPAPYGARRARTCPAARGGLGGPLRWRHAIKCSVPPFRGSPRHSAAHQQAMVPPAAEPSFRISLCPPVHPPLWCGLIWATTFNSASRVVSAEDIPNLCAFTGDTF